MDQERLRAGAASLRLRIYRSRVERLCSGRLHAGLRGLSADDILNDIHHPQVIHSGRRVIGIVRELADFGIAVQLHDPMADSDPLHEEYSLSLTPLDELKPADTVVLAVGHHAYREGGGSW
ncbi:MAG TPA: UDP binding domain-containing protein [Reyranella sp.]|nr:UDP binding domain-containing protein [Reyranella sp.]